MKVKENALSQEQIDQWKTEFGHVYKTMSDGNAIIWRKLKRKEYIDIMTSVADDEEGENPQQRLYRRQDLVVKTVTLYPNDIEKLIEESGGLATNIAEQVMEKSGFDTAEAEEL